MADTRPLLTVFFLRSVSRRLRVFVDVVIISLAIRHSAETIANETTVVVCLNGRIAAEDIDVIHTRIFSISTSSVYKIPALCKVRIRDSMNSTRDSLKLRYFLVREING